MPIDDYEMHREIAEIQERQASALEWIAASLERIADHFDGTPPPRRDGDDGPNTTSIP